MNPAHLPDRRPRARELRVGDFFAPYGHAGQWRRVVAVELVAAATLRVTTHDGERWHFATTARVRARRPGDPDAPAVATVDPAAHPCRGRRYHCEDPGCDCCGGRFSLSWADALALCAGGAS